MIIIKVIRQIMSFYYHQFGTELTLFVFVKYPIIYKFYSCLSIFHARGPGGIFTVEYVLTL